MDIPEPLLPPFSIVHCFQQVLRATSQIGTELLCIGFSWSSCLCSSIFDFVPNPLIFLKLFFKHFWIVYIKLERPTDIHLNFFFFLFVFWLAECVSFLFVGWPCTKIQRSNVENSRTNKPSNPYTSFQTWLPQQWALMVWSKFWAMLAVVISLSQLFLLDYSKPWPPLVLSENWYSQLLTNTFRVMVMLAFLQHAWP